MSIYIPYFYIIQEISTGMYYAGSKFSKGTTPDGFMQDGGYTTSSTTINYIIELQGVQSFKVRKLKIFYTGEEAYNYETRFLVRVDARNNPSFYNLHNNDGYMNPAKYKQIMQRLYGVDCYSQTPEYKIKTRQTCLERYGVEHYSQTQEYKERSKSTRMKRYGDEVYVRSEKSKCENVVKYGVPYTTQAQEIKEKMYDTLEQRYGSRRYMQTNDFKQKRRDTMRMRYGVDHPAQNEHVNNTRRATNSDRYGVNEVFASNHFREKCKQTWLDRYGVEYYMQSENARLERSRRYTGEGNPRYGKTNTIEQKRKACLNRQRPVLIDGTRFLHAFEAAEALSLSTYEVKKRLHSKDPLYSEWYYEDVGKYTPKPHGNTDRRRPDLAARNKSQRHRYVIEGILYDSVDDAAVALGVKPCTIRRKSKSDKYPEWVCLKSYEVHIDGN